MKTETLKALNESIEHWTNLISGRETDAPVAANCALCQRFGSGCRLIGGEKCPVYQITGIRQCQGSPYYEAAQAFQRPGWREAARKELDFLISLRPKPTLDLTKPVQTRDGRPARIICTDRVNGGEMNIIALVTQSKGYETVQTYNLLGHHHTNPPCSEDLVNVVPRPASYDENLPKTKPTFDPTKPAQNRKGWPARIICTDRCDTLNIIALYKDSQGSEGVSLHTSDGRCPGSPEHDLVNVVPRPEPYPENLAKVAAEGFQRGLTWPPEWTQPPGGPYVSTPKDPDHPRLLKERQEWLLGWADGIRAQDPNHPLIQHEDFPK